jgi:hypothetical protein
MELLRPQAHGGVRRCAGPPAARHQRLRVRHRRCVGLGRSALSHLRTSAYSLMQSTMASPSRSMGFGLPGPHAEFRACPQVPVGSGEAGGFGSFVAPGDEGSPDKCVSCDGVGDGGVVTTGVGEASSGPCADLRSTYSATAGVEHSRSAVVELMTLRRWRTVIGPFSDLCVLSVGFGNGSAGSCLAVRTTILH